MKQPPQKMYSLFQPLKLRRPSNDERKSNPEQSDEEDDDMDVPLASLAARKPQLKKRNIAESSNSQTQPKKPRGWQTSSATTSVASSKSINQTMLSFQVVQKGKIPPKEKVYVVTNQENIVKHTGPETANQPLIETEEPYADESNDIRVSDEESPAQMPSSDNTETDSDKILAENEIKSQSQTTSKKKKVLLRKRYRSQASSECDFFPPQNVKQSIPALLSQLVNRSTLGNRPTSRALMPQKWKSPSWVSLQQNSASNIEHMAWDKMGVFLAVAYSDKWISVYDWDMVRAADMHGKNDRLRQIKDSEFKIPPILKFRVSYSVASLAWNPHNLDQLAVGFRVSGHVHLYNVERVSVWQSRKQRNLVSIPPKKTFISLSFPRVCGSANVVSFLDPETVFVGIGTTVYSWKLQKDQTTLAWRFQPPSSVTCASPFGPNLLLLGTAKGHFCLLNWKRYTKERAFSSENRPIVIQEWIPHTKLKDVTPEQRRTMGILKMKVKITSQTGNPKKSSPWGCCQVSWITTGGWMLSTVLESETIRGNCQVRHETRKVRYLNPDGSETQIKKKEWSQPQDPIGVCMSNSRLITWSDVPAVTKILPHHDKYVVSQRQVVRSEKRALLFWDEASGITQSIKLPFKTTPQTIAFHPGPELEWAVLGVGKKLVVLCGKC